MLSLFILLVQVISAKNCLFRDQYGFCDACEPFYDFYVGQCAQVSNHAQIVDQLSKRTFKLDQVLQNQQHREIQKLKPPQVNLNRQLQSVAKLGDKCAENKFYGYDPTKINQESSQLLADADLLVCASCGELISGCELCSTATQCAQCAKGAFKITMASGRQECFYHFAGFGSGVNYDTSQPFKCTKKDCKQCQIVRGVESCGLCDVGYYLNSLNICSQVRGTTQIDLYVLSFKGLKMTQEQLTAMKSTSRTFGESLAEPFFFLQQAFNTLYTLKADRLNTYDTVSVNIYLGKGDHYFFSCSSNNVAVAKKGWAGVTDFCLEIDSLKDVYAQSDAFQIKIQPLYCSGAEPSEAAQKALFKANCLQPQEKPTVHQINPHTHLNVTNTLQAHSIKFIGASSNAYYASNENIREFPQTFCALNSASGTLEKQVVAPFSYSCAQLAYLAQCEVDPGKRCEGEPYSDAYFQVLNGDSTYVKRHSSLFVLYPFDSMHTTVLKTPSLMLSDCVFQDFVDEKQESLILAQTNNLLALKCKFSCRELVKISIRIQNWLHSLLRN